MKKYSLANDDYLKQFISDDNDCGKIEPPHAKTNKMICAPSED